MNRRGIAISIAAALVVATTFLSCNLFANTSPVSFWAASLTLGDGGKIAGVSVQVNNAGKGIDTAEYEVLLTLNDLTAYDAVLYRGSTTIPSGSSTIQVSWNTQIKPYLNAHSISIRADSYRIGFQYDPDGRTDNSGSSGQAVCPRELWVINDSPCPYVASGTIAYGSSSTTLQYYDGSTWAPLPGGTYDLYVGFVSTDALPTGTVGGVTPEGLFYPGWQRIELPYETASFPSTRSFRCGVPEAGSYMLVAFVDANRNGLLDADSTGVIEPNGTLLDTKSYMPTVIYMNDHVSGLTLDWLSPTYGVS